MRQLTLVRLATQKHQRSDNASSLKIDLYLSFTHQFRRVGLKEAVDCVKIVLQIR